MKVAIILHPIHPKKNTRILLKFFPVKTVKPQFLRNCSRYRPMGFDPKNVVTILKVKIYPIRVK